MNLKKIAILGLCTFILGIQLFIIIPKIRNIIPYKGLWPFQNYAMYSAAYYPGDSFTILDLYITEETENRKLSKLTYSDLHIMPKRFRNFMKNSVIITKNNSGKNKQNEAIEFLNFLIKKYQKKSVFNVEIWGKTYAISENGLENKNVIPKLLSSWKVKNDLFEIIDIEKNGTVLK